jgi:hypothetical protein
MESDLTDGPAPSEAYSDAADSKAPDSDGA